MRFLADLLYLVAGIAYLPVAVYNALVVGKNRRGWRERFGRIPERKPAPRRIWIHAVSLGEINATPRLVELIKKHHADCDIVVSTTTDTGFARAVHFYKRHQVFRFPLDFSFVMERVFDRVKPTMIVLVEQEIWFNHVRIANQRKVPVAVVNGRMTDRSCSRYRLLGAPVKQMFGSLSWVGAQDETIAERFRVLGTPPENVQIVPSLKWDSAAVTDHVDGSNRLADALGLNRDHPVWVCGSTGPGEETIILDAYDLWPHSHPKPRLVIVPRKPERFDDVAQLIQRRGYQCLRRSKHRDEHPATNTMKSAVILGDTMGELRKLYNLADVVFVGRSLVKLGGSDPMEVAALGKPTIMGPYTSNFARPVAALKKGGGLMIVKSSQDLARVVQGLLQDKDLASRTGGKARNVVLAHMGGTERTVEALLNLMP